MNANQCLDSTRFRGTEAIVAGDRQGTQPDLQGTVVAIDVHVGRFRNVVAEPVDPIWPGSKDGGHRDGLHRVIAWDPKLFHCPPDPDGAGSDWEREAAGLTGVPISLADSRNLALDLMSLKGNDEVMKYGIVLVTPVLRTVILGAARCGDHQKDWKLVERLNRQSVALDPADGGARFRGRGVRPRSRVSDRP